MMSAQFEYDEIGNTFYYVIVSFYALILIPITYFLYPRKHTIDEKDHARRCFCDGCDDKWRRKQATKPWNNVKRYTSRIILFIGWIGFAILVYRITLIKVDHQEYNPYAILGLDVNAPDAEIRKQYRHLSKTAHPDRGGDAIQFDRIAKAYQALTDAESKENWEKYGNPDGPVATTFGIALPKWLVSKEYGVWVLAVYGLVFMIVLPVGVGIWWYNSIKYSVDQVLMDTTQLYGFFFHKTPNMELKRVLMILGSSFEFWKQYNKEIVERESDDIQLPQLIKELPNLSEKKKERPLCLPYSLKARVLLHAHLTRIPLPSQTLDKDRQYIIRKAPILIQEMIQVIQQLIFYASHGRVQRVPTLETIENVMRLLPMIVQAVWGNKSPLFQLPHFTDDVLRHCVNKRRRVTTCAELAALDEQQRRLLLQTLSDDEYADVIHVLSMMPKIKIESCLVEVQGEDDKHEITAGSLVTLKVTLSRSPLLDPNRPVTLPVVVDDEPDDDDVDDEDQNSTAQVAKRKPWEKPKKKKGGKAGKKAQPKPKPLKKVPVVTPAIANKSTDATTSVDEVPNGIVKLRDDARKSREERDSDNDSDASIVDVSEEETGGGADRRDDDDNNNDGIGANNGDDDDDDDNLVFDDELIKKDLVLATKSKVTHPVHCPYYPDEKYEWWWLYMIDKKHKRIVSGPVQCTTLIDEQMIELKFSAPPEKGTYSYTVIVRSDSYMDGDQTKEIKFEVLEARQVTTHPQWEEVDEEQKSEHSEDASEYTEHDDSDDD